jgi:tetratricopeptide (TPR) repeat protein
VVEFVGRTQKLQELHTQLQQNDRLAITAIAGMGGIGKTELALQYAIAQLQQSQYPAGLCWLRARDQEIATQIVTFAQAHLGLTPPDKLEIEAQVRFCWQQWPEGDALVVLDDVTNYDAIAPYLPPSDQRFKLLITTRLELGSTVKNVSIEELNEDSAIALLESLVGCDRIQEQIEDVKALCKRVGYLPLGLELLGRFLARKRDWTVSRLIEQLASKSLATKALMETEAGMTAQLGVAEALELSWQELNEAEQELACVLGMFAIAPIPWSLVEQCVNKFNPDDLEDTRDDGLMGRSLLKQVGEDSYQLHQIVQEYFRIKLEQRSDQSQDIKSSFCSVMVAIAKAIDDTPGIDEIERVKEAITHLKEVIKRWIDVVSHKDFLLPFLGVGRFYEGQGSYSVAELWYRDCLEETQKFLGAEHQFVATSQVNLAELYRKQGRYKEAEPLFLQALLSSLKVFGLEHPSVALIQNGLAGLYSNQGRYEEAEPLYKKALYVLQKVFGGEHTSIAFNVNGLAVLYRNQGRYEEAEPLYEQALQIFKKVLGEEHPHVALSQYNLATFYHTQGQCKEAEVLYLQALQIREKKLGLEHPDVATSLNSLASLYTDQNRDKEAEALYIQVLQMRRKILGLVHPDVAISLNNFGAFCHKQGRYEEAELLYLAAQEIYLKALGLENPNVAACLNNLAEIYRKQGRHEEAEPLYKQSLKIIQKVLGSERLDVANILSNLAQIYREKGRYEEAEPLYKQSLEIKQKLLGPEQSEVAIIQCNLGILYQKEGRFKEAKVLYLKAIVIAEAKLGLDHRNTQNIRGWLNSLPKEP